MPLLIRNKTKCGICKKIIHDEKVVAIPDFSYQQDKELDFFSNKIFHHQCFVDHPLYKKVASLLKEIEEKYDQKICYISGEPITIENVKHPDNHIFTGVLTKNSNNPLFKYNNIHLNKRYLEFWEEIEDFKSLIVDKINKSEENLAFRNLLIELNSPIHPPLKKEIIERYKNRFV